jgi:hypothetical protein
MSRFLHRLLWWTGLAFAIAALPLTSKANSIIFSTFGPSHSSNCCSGFGESGSGTQAPDIVAMAFTPSVTSALGTIDVAIGGGGTSNQYTLALMTNNGGVPGSILERWSVTSSFGFGSCSSCFNSVFASQHIVLQAGVQYWLVPFPSSGFDGSWQDNIVGSSGSLATSLDGGKTWSGLGVGASELLMLRVLFLSPAP